MTAGRRTGRATRALDARAAVSGLLAAALTIAVGYLLSAFFGSAPLAVVGDAFIDLTPGWLKDLAISLFGLHDKTALLVGMVLVLALLAAGLGLVARRRPTVGTIGVLALGVVGALAAASRPDAGALAVVPSLGGAFVGAFALSALLSRGGLYLPAPVPSPGRGPDSGGDTGGGTGAGTGLGTGGGVRRGDDGHGEDAPPVGQGAAAAPVRQGAATAPVRQGVAGQGLDRRGFLGTSLAVAAVAAISTAVGAMITAGQRTVDAVRSAVRLPTATRLASPVPSGAQAPVEGVVDIVTPNNFFYRIDTAFTPPQVDPDTWQLRVHGMVEQEVTVSFADLLAADLVESYVTLTCVSNEVGGDLAGNAKWLGLPVREVLARARPLPDADMVLSTSADGFTASTPIEALTDDRDALLAVGMNGEPLPVAHGFPVRMVVPGLYGYVSATKWVVDLEVTRFADRTAYWTDRGWSPEGPIKTASRIEVPHDGDTVALSDAGDERTVGIGGTAWAQHTGITGVEVQVDDDDWREVTLADAISIDTWRQWSWRWPATPGRHTLRVRATDSSGTVQTSDRANPVPDGASGWHEIEVTVE